MVLIGFVDGNFINGGVMEEYGIGWVAWLFGAII